MLLVKVVLGKFCLYYAGSPPSLGIPTPSLGIPTLSLGIQTPRLGNKIAPFLILSSESVSKSRIMWICDCFASARQSP